MTKQSSGWFKETLEWLHHAYWIREFVLSTGVWTAVMTWAVRNSYVAAQYKWPITISLIGVSLYVGSALRTRSSRKGVLKQGANSLVANTANASLLPDINLQEFFRVAYRSDLEAEIRKNYEILAHREEPNNPEEFYLRFIGVGLVAAIYDSVWWPMFRSQLLALIEVTRRGGQLPLEKVKAFYEQAAGEYPTEYANDNLDRWLSYLTKNSLLIRHPSDIVEITVRGKDFLKYLTHWGRSANDKRL